MKTSSNIIYPPNILLRQIKPGEIELTSEYSDGTIRVEKIRTNKNLSLPQYIQEIKFEQGVI